ncbi:transcriptional regulatory protein, LysR family [Nitrosococcus oceani ATCC 19707]|uniref:HTH-type transcriptional regulator MetR n=2 Tax=Nitrosococcus oceani TaxID=1229 RepID=Q3JA41_NITOC|nr:LysR family transcriptional regulator [Nitrosococcus oceani]ABA58305.1 transcriptional regulatory protein, LysR family [Nitrosococcus oceani ATCC 19707]EDZ67308.1 transcriptional regulator, MarR family [Nitrosococcus oceani AFC27]KFI19235.1 XRE family transcriptional regulator [Nitrosococcus oceani C-27]GEM18689.1 XRE family transcriptional regulator [Nitrosococcus oceani]
MFIELRHLRTLLSLRETGSVSQAAERLHLTQSAVSHQLKALEEHFECPLFTRKSHPLRLTSAGQRLLELATTILPQVEAAERELASMADGRAGRLHIAVECHSCFQWLLPSMDIFRNRWPEVEMDLSLGFNFEPLPALERGDIDLVVTSDPLDLPNISYEALFRFQGMLVVPPRHHLGAKAWVEPADLKKEILITYPVGRDRLSLYTHFLDPAGIEPAGQRTAELTLMILQLVANNRGVAALPNWAIVEEIKQGAVKALPLGKEGLWATLFTAVRAEEKERFFMQDFIQLARETCFQNLSGILPASADYPSNHALF